MKTVGIVTFYLNYNFGTSLQCYALKRAVEGLGGCEVRIIPHAFGGRIENGFAGKELREAFDERIRAFDWFLKNVIGCTEENIPHLTAENAPVCSHYITGSDTVWNTVQTGGDKAYFLDFAGKDAVKISYAPSLGVSDTGRLNREIFEKNIDRFDFLSVREKRNIEFLKQFTDKAIQPVLDPTLLLEAEDYAGLEENIPEDRYILVYMIYDDSESVSYTLNLANRLAVKYDMKVIHFIYNIPDYIFGEKGKSFAFCNIGEFLSYVKKADLVLTNSYHGTAFSIIYQRPFYCYLRKDGRTKLEELLEGLWLKSRILPITLNLDEIDMYLDYSEAYRRLKEKRKLSMDFLKEALQ